MRFKTMSDEKKDITTTKEKSKTAKMAGKGMSPIKGYNYKNWYDGYDRIFKKVNKKKEK